MDGECTAHERAKKYIQNFSHKIWKEETAWET